MTGGINKSSAELLSLTLLFFRTFHYGGKFLSHSVCVWGGNLKALDQTAATGSIGSNSFVQQIVLSMSDTGVQQEAI